MTHFIDLHIHSRFSRATSPALTPRNLDFWAGLKGLSLIGTGDMTHPAWLDELETALQRRADGFYSLKEKPDGVRFVPTGEVSAIYKQDGRTRKIHLVVAAPSLEEARKFSKVLGALGNVEADGRPILGLSARNILEIALSVSAEMIVIPAHIWTPWFSLFGARSGFDRLEECFGDLSGHITALETGLSSDPAMNRLVSSLDRYALVSSSDAHSPDKLGREATLLAGAMSWDNLAAALKGGPSLAGTVEFFPEEGKYHLDGHLACGQALRPEETRAAGGLCPVCGKPVTIGVLHRVQELADRESPLAGRLPDLHLIPLAELLSQVFGVGPKSRKVTESFERLTSELDRELPLLLETPLSDIETAAGPLLRLAIEKMRRGEVRTEGGYDGQYGTATAISPAEREALSGQGRLFDFSPRPSRPSRLQPPSLFAAHEETAEPETAPARARPPLALRRGDLLLDGLDESQIAAVTCRRRALAVLAGPGSGKTRVLVHRAAWLVREKAAGPEEMLLTTYTRQAALSLAVNFRAALPFRPESALARVSTLHALAYDLLKRAKPDWELASEQALEELRKKAAKKAGLKPGAFAALAARAKNGPATLGGEIIPPPGAPEAFAPALAYYAKTLARARLWDFDDLIAEAAPPPGSPPLFKAVLVDEFQDLSAAQFSFIKRLLPPQSSGAFLTAIGDPDQSIYGFRGADPAIFDWLKVYPDLETAELSTNYRSVKNIVAAGEAVIARPEGPARPERARPKRVSARTEKGPRLTRAALANPRREAAYVVGRVMAHLGVLNLGQPGSSRQDQEFMPGLALNEVAVIFRLRALGRAVAEALDQRGLAWQMSGEDPLTAIDHLDFTADKISLLTMHAAKGLE
ncbi:MAG: UvrD-helicase domain-containing protein, partial [Candidatus Adiutrix sp.]|nr:UvrD-helicase domain-containing protein [Candidatus Adiutrix sp.]